MLRCPIPLTKSMAPLSLRKRAQEHRSTHDIAPFVGGQILGSLPYKLFILLALLSRGRLGWVDFPSRPTYLTIRDVPLRTVPR
jgi:hypothetical protein